jgi:hypothetical protein
MLLCVRFFLETKEPSSVNAFGLGFFDTKKNKMEEDNGWKKRRSSIAAGSKVRKGKKAAPAYKIRKRNGFGDIMQDLSQTRTRMDIGVCTLGLVGLFIQIAVVEITFRNNEETTDFLNILKIVVSMTTLVAIVMNAVSTKASFDAAKMSNTLLPGDNLWTSGAINQFALETFVFMIHSFPW